MRYYLCRIRCLVNNLARMIMSLKEVINEPCCEVSNKLVEVCEELRNRFEQIPTKEDYRAAIDSQNGCNLSAIIYQFSDVMERICYQANIENHGTDWRNTHPICRLYSEQIYHLTQNTDWQNAYDECERIAEINK